MPHLHLHLKCLTSPPNAVNALDLKERFPHTKKKQHQNRCHLPNSLLRQPVSSLHLILAYDGNMTSSCRHNDVPTPHAVIMPVSCRHRAVSTPSSRRHHVVSCRHHTNITPASSNHHAFITPASRRHHAVITPPSLVTRRHYAVTTPSLVPPGVLQVVPQALQPDGRTGLPLVRREAAARPSPGQDGYDGRHCRRRRRRSSRRGRRSRRIRLLEDWTERGEL